MKAIRLLLSLLAVVGLAWGACKHGTATPFRSVEGCAINRMYRPLCGTDDCNYVNDDALKCAQLDDRRRSVKEEDVVRMAYAGMCQEAETGEETNNA